MDWRIAMYLDPADYSIEGLAGVSGFTAPDFFLDLADPTNANYTKVINTSNGVNNHRALIDLSDLGISDWNTIDGQNHLAFLIPTVTGANNGLVTGTALSDNSGWTSGVMEGLYDEPFDQNGADTFLNYGFSYGNVAGRVTTQSAVLLGDVNLDGQVNLLDVSPFIDRISSGDYQAEADCNEDGVVNLLDVDPFIALLAGG